MLFSVSRMFFYFVLFCFFFFSNRTGHLNRLMGDVPSMLQPLAHFHSSSTVYELHMTGIYIVNLHIYFIKILQRKHTSNFLDDFLRNDTSMYDNDGIVPRNYKVFTEL